MKTRQQMVDLGYTPDPSPAVMHFLTARLSDKDIADLRRQIPRKDLVEAWRDIEDHAKELAKRLTGKEAATPSRTWQLLSSARPEMTLFLAVTARQQAVAQKIKNFFTKWRQVQQKIPSARDDGVADHAATAGVSEDRARCFHAAARRQTALAHGDAEVSEAVCAAATAAAASAQAGTRRQGGCCRGAAPNTGAVAAGEGKEGEGRQHRRSAAPAALPVTAKKPAAQFKPAKTASAACQAKLTRSPLPKSASRQAAKNKPGTRRRASENQEKEK